jgi:hypothetical protein
MARDGDPVEPVEELMMRRFMLRAAMLTALALGAVPAHADNPPIKSECQGGLCGTPGAAYEPPASWWDEVLAWLGLD